MTDPNNPYKANPYSQQAENWEVRESHRRQAESHQVWQQAADEQLAWQRRQEEAENERERRRAAERAANTAKRAQQKQAAQAKAGISQASKAPSARMVVAAAVFVAAALLLFAKFEFHWAVALIIALIPSLLAARHYRALLVCAGVAGGLWLFLSAGVGPPQAGPTAPVGEVPAVVAKSSNHHTPSVADDRALSDVRHSDAEGSAGAAVVAPPAAYVLDTLPVDPDPEISVAPAREAPVEAGWASAGRFDTSSSERHEGYETSLPNLLPSSQFHLFGDSRNRIAEVSFSAPLPEVIAGVRYDRSRRLLVFVGSSGQLYELGARLSVEMAAAVEAADEMDLVRTSNGSLVAWSTVPIENRVAERYKRPSVYGPIFDASVEARAVNEKRLGLPLFFPSAADFDLHADFETGVASLRHSLAPHRVSYAKFYALSHVLVVVDDSGSEFELGVAVDPRLRRLLLNSTTLDIVQVSSGSIEARRSTPLLHIDGSSEGKFWLGFGFETTQRGLRLTSVLAGTAASEAGLAPGDYLLALDGQRMLSQQDLAHALASASDSTLYTAVVVRNGASFEVPLEPQRIL